MHCLIISIGMKEANKATRQDYEKIKVRAD